MPLILQDVFLGNNIRSLRISKGYTQAQVVEKMQLMGSAISRRTYSHIESGKRNIKASDLIAIKSVLAVQYDDIFKTSESLQV